MPDSVDRALKIAGIKGERFWPMSIDEIKKMTANMDIDIHSFHSLRYRSMWENEVLSFEDIEESEMALQTFDNDPQIGNRYNYLLYWLSAIGKGSWHTFAKTCVILGLVDEARKARNVFRKLRLLGHVECSPDGLRWQVCPSTMVLSPDGNYCFLCGQRTPGLEKQLNDQYFVTYIDQHGFQGPTAIRVDIDEGCMNDGNFIWTGPASLNLATVLPDIEGWKRILPMVDRLNIHNYSIEKWEDDEYCPYNSFFQREKRYEGQSGLYRLTQKNSKYSYNLNLYFDYERQHWLKGDWYGLRFLSAYGEGKDLKAHYDYEKSCLIVQNSQCWPLVYEKELVLASGKLPKFIPKKRLQLYYEIPAELSNLLAKKLNVSLEVKEYA